MVRQHILRSVVPRPDLLAGGGTRRVAHSGVLAWPELRAAIEALRGIARARVERLGPGRHPARGRRGSRERPLPDRAGRGPHPRPDPVPAAIAFAATDLDLARFGIHDLVEILERVRLAAGSEAYGVRDDLLEVSGGRGLYFGSFDFGAGASEPDLCRRSRSRVEDRIALGGWNAFVGPADPAAPPEFDVRRLLDRHWLRSGDRGPDHVVLLPPDEIDPRDVLALLARLRASTGLGWAIDPLDGSTRPPAGRISSSEDVRAGFLGREPTAPP